LTLKLVRTLLLKVSLIACLGFGAALCYGQDKPPDTSKSIAKHQSNHTVMVNGVAEPVYGRGSKGVTPPKAIFTRPADYPQDPKTRDIQGTVVLSFVVTSTGEITDIRVSRGLGFGFDEKAVEVLRNWKFHPAMKDSRAVSAEIILEQEFRR